MKKFFIAIGVLLCVAIIVGFGFLLVTTFMDFMDPSKTLAMLKTRIVTLMVVAIILTIVGSAAQLLLLFVLRRNKGKRTYN